MRAEIIDSTLGAADSVAIVGGHYCVAPDLEDLSADADTEQNTFAYATEIAAAFRAAGKRAKIVLWVNDIGIDLAARNQLKHHYVLPTSYAAIFARAGLSDDTLVVLFESMVRNKASVLLRDIFKRSPGLFRVMTSDAPELVRCIDQCETGDAQKEAKKAYVVTGPDGENLVVKEGPNPKCNLILGTLFHLIATRIGPAAVITVFNSIYANRIRLGMHVAAQVFACRTPIRSVFMDGAELLPGSMSATGAVRSLNDVSGPQPPGEIQ